jgi:hypothetical protein
VNSVHDKLRKLLALAQQGVGGERDNAQALLEALMKKHGISVDDLAEETREMKTFKWKGGEYEKRLLSQVITSVVLNCSIYQDRRKGRSRAFHAKVSRSEQLEIDLRYSVYLAAMQREMLVFYKAFVQKNDIFHSDAPPSDSKMDEAELKRMAMAMMAMQKVQIHRTLTNS